MPVIMIADDKEENRYVLKNFFKLFGRTDIVFVEAASTDESIEKIKKTNPDLVLLDIKMETDYAGFDVVKRIRSEGDFAHIQIWAITAHALEAHDREESDKDKCLNAGFNDFISKPFDPVNLLLKTSTYLNIPLPETVRKKLGIN